MPGAKEVEGFTETLMIRAAGPNPNARIERVHGDSGRGKCASVKYAAGQSNCSVNLTIPGISLESHFLKAAFLLQSFECTCSTCRVLNPDCGSEFVSTGAVDGNARHDEVFVRLVA